MGQRESRSHALRLAQFDRVSLSEFFLLLSSYLFSLISLLSSSTTGKPSPGSFETVPLLDLRDVLSLSKPTRTQRDPKSKNVSPLTLTSSTSNPSPSRVGILLGSCLLDLLAVSLYLFLSVSLLKFFHQSSHLTSRTHLSSLPS